MAKNLSRRFFYHNLLIRVSLKGGQPELFLALRTALRQGDIPKAQRLQQQINEVVENLVARGVFQSAKYLAGKGVVDTGPTREPFVALTATQREDLDALHQRLQGYIADV